MSEQQQQQQPRQRETYGAPFSVAEAIGAAQSGRMNEYHRDLVLFLVAEVNRLEGELACSRAKAHECETILHAPRVALFADGREPTTNERHLLNLLEWRMRETRHAQQECDRLLGVIADMAKRDQEQG